MSHLLQYPHVAEPRRGGLADAHETTFPQVGEEDADDSERQVELGREIGDRGARAAEPEQADVLRSKVGNVINPKLSACPARCRRDQRDHVDAAARGPGPPGRQRVGPDHPLAVVRAWPAGSQGLHAARLTYELTCAGRGRTPRCWPTRLTSSAISYAIRPASAPAVASTARQLPSPAAVTNKNADSSSTIVCSGLPQLKCWPNPLARLWNPAATAARCSASSLVRSADAPIARPSRDRITALSI